jgi:phosphoribosyl 1,2-cyclic phosphodiesterase
VHHGRFFSTLPARDFYPTPTSLSPASTNPSTPPLQPSTPLPIEDISELGKAIQPYLCLGFIVQDAVVYLSDVSHIPEDIWAMFGRAKGADQTQPVPPVFVLDCLRLQPHTSHLGVAESVAVARRMGAQRTYLTGFGHEVSHDEYVTVSESVGGKTKAEAELTPTEKEALSLISPGEPIWVRPAFDGLRVFVSSDKQVRDDTYQ